MGLDGMENGAFACQEGQEERHNIRETWAWTKEEASLTTHDGLGTESCQLLGETGPSTRGGTARATWCRGGGNLAFTRETTIRIRSAR